MKARPEHDIKIWQARWKRWKAFADSILNHEAPRYREAWVYAYQAARRREMGIER